MSELALLVPKRRVSAVYVVWKDQSYPIPILQEVGTFYSRNTAAARVICIGAPLPAWRPGPYERKIGCPVAHNLAGQTGSSPEDIRELIVQGCRVILSGSVKN